MLPTPKSYAIWPSVFKADTISAVTVAPAERAYIIPDGKVYSVNIISINSDENYYAPENHKRFDVTGQNGALNFEFEFVGEGEHLIQLIFEEKVIESFKVYSLFEDLYALRPLKGDLHSHSCRSDGTRDPAMQAGHYREEGYDFVALTDHNRFYPGGEIDETYLGVETGLVRIPGEEVHSPGSVVHIVHVGGDASVAKRYVSDRENYEKEIAEYMTKVPSDIPEIYKSRYAKAMWATDAIHSVGGLAIFPHPFWRPGRAKSYNLTDSFARILLKSGMFDAYEAIGAMTQPDINLSIALWAETRAEGNNIPIVGSSDVHSLERSTHFPYYHTVCFAKEKSPDSIIAAIKSGMCVAVESNGYEYDIQYRCYGNFRLVAYAQFLLSNYFPTLKRLSAGIGVAMRAYAMEETDAKTVSAYSKIADSFTERFFGRLAPILPSDSMINFEEKWRAVQLEGPRTRGSSVDAAAAKSLI